MSNNDIEYSKPNIFQIKYSIKLIITCAYLNINRINLDESLEKKDERSDLIDMMYKY